MAEPGDQKGDAAPETILRLAQAGQVEPFLAAHHVEAARRLSRLFERARMRQRVTMSYDPTRVGGSKGRPQQGELAASAIEARRLLVGLAERMPRDCWVMLMDVCGYDKGVQQIETERGWPRRSAKLVLRIALDHLARQMGLGAAARGGEATPMRNWLPDRPPMFPEAAKLTL